MNSKSDEGSLFDKPQDMKRDTPFTFELTLECTQRARSILLLEKGKGSHIRKFGPQSIEGNYDTKPLDIWSQDSVLTHGLELAQSFNQVEVKRVQRERDRLLATTPSEQLESSPIQAAMTFYVDVLNEYRLWFHEHKLEFLAEPSPNHEKAGDQYAHFAYPYLDQARSLAELYKVAYSDPDAMEDDLKFFRKSLRRAGYYVRDRDKSTAGKYDEMCARIKDYVLNGITPERLNSK